jgi:hypothetical protein
VTDIQRAAAGRKTPDLNGMTFGRLTVVRRAGWLGKPRTASWLCRCTCGRETVVRASNLTLGAVASCGCAVGRKAYDLNGMRFGRLTVLARAGWGGGKHRMPAWLCRCACGGEKVVTGSNLKQSQTESCGCLQSESERNRTHGLTDSPEYGIWVAMQSSCLNPTQKGFKSRGSRGIEVCEQWLGSFEVFIADVGMRPTPKHWLRRKDTRGNFEPGNVHWRLPGKAGES